MRLSALFLVTSLNLSSVKSEDGYPEIEDLFPHVNDSEIEPLPNVDFDIERIDLDKFKVKLEVLEKQMVGNETRRQAFDYITRYQWNRARNNILKVKVIDLMLQTIYMTRHRLRALENEKHFDKNDAGYRVAFLYRKLRRLWRRMMDLRTQIELKHTRLFWYADLEDGFMMHMKAIKMYEDFQYLWWVLINIDGRYLSRRRTTTTKKTTSSFYVSRTSRTKTTPSAEAVSLAGGV